MLKINIKPWIHVRSLHSLRALASDSCHVNSAESQFSDWSAQPVENNVNGNPYITPRKLPYFKILLSDKWNFTSYVGTVSSILRIKMDAKLVLTKIVSKNRIWKRLMEGGQIINFSIELVCTRKDYIYKASTQILLLFGFYE